jgi:glycosyltransferase involved in cell wall biosynthesis
VAGDNIGYQSIMRGPGALSLVNPQDAIDFARRLELFLYEDELRRMWLNWAKNYVKQFDYSKVVDLYEQAYKEAIKIHERAKVNTP